MKALTTLKAISLLFIIYTFFGCSNTEDPIDPDEPEGLTVSDIDGNKYGYVQIGEQHWMAENLRTATLNDGVSIDNLQNDEQWLQTVEPAYSWYDNDSDYNIPYGKLYNWYAVETGKLCPTGWHVPTDDEWKALIIYLDNGDWMKGILPGDKIKETDPSYWKSLNTGATNETGFTALPAGYRNKDASFNSLNHYAMWWSAVKFQDQYKDGAFFFNVSGHRRDIEDGVAEKNSGLSVRCLKD